jgi:hypothetical protein
MYTPYLVLYIISHNLILRVFILFTQTGAPQNVKAIYRSRR